MVRSTTVIVNKEEGLYIDFVPVEGKPILNALQLKKLVVVQFEILRNHNNTEYCHADEGGISGSAT